MAEISGFKFSRDGQTVDMSDHFVDRNIFIGGGVMAWGYAGYGALGSNSITISKSSPVQMLIGGLNWVDISAGSYTTAMIDYNGSLWVVGSNQYGELGINSASTVHRSSPVQTISGGTNWKQVSTGSSGTMAAVKTDGTLWLWGRNVAGRIGDNTAVNRSSPVQTISGGTDWKQVGCGENHTAAIKTDGTLWTWGYNNDGQLGIGLNALTNRSSPVQTVAGGINWSQVACGTNHTAAIKTDGTLWLWGVNLYGQLGDGTIASKSSPVQTICGGTNWKQVACGISNTAAIKTDGTLWTWGINVYAFQGDNTVINRSSPVQTVAGGTNWRSVDINGVLAAIKTDGTLWVCGNNQFGELGVNGTSVVTRSSPVQTITGGTNWTHVSAGDIHTVGLRTDQ